MARLHYLGEPTMRILAERLTATLFTESSSFRLLGDSGRERMLSALAQPRWPQYPDLQAKAAALHFHLNKGHAYSDGNKRIALVAAELFLMVNGAGLVATSAELEALALGVADNAISREENEAFFRERCFRVGWSQARREKWAAGLPAEGRAALGLAATARRHEYVAALRRLGEELQEEIDAARTR